MVDWTVWLFSSPGKNKLNSIEKTIKNFQKSDFRAECAMQVHSFPIVLRLSFWNIQKCYIHNQRQRTTMKRHSLHFFLCISKKDYYDCFRKIKTPCKLILGWYGHFLTFIYIYEVLSEFSFGTQLDFIP